MSEKPTYHFGFTDGGDAGGLNDPLAWNFKGSPVHTLVREALQNIIDARITDPARAVFRMRQIKPTKIPGHKKLTDIMMRCRDFNKKMQNDTAVTFFENAADMLRDKTSISVLEIADYNTTGLTGANNDPTGNYFSFLKTLGASNKGASKGGSFGLGKGSYFALSDFRTIFVSSIYEKDKYVFQGKLRPSSFKNEEGKIMQSNGTFGMRDKTRDQIPVRDAALIPEYFKRSDQGTSIYVLGFNEEEDWKENVTKAALDNFWMAILRGTLEVEVGDTRISRENLDENMFNFFSERDRDNDKAPNPLPYYLAYTDEDAAEIFPADLPVLGEVELRILLKDYYRKRVVYFRETGMVIQKKLKHCVRSYAGVFSCPPENEIGNQILRNMENPRHNEWNPDFVKSGDEDEKKVAKKALAEINTFIRGVLDGLSEGEDAEHLSIQELEKYLYLPEDESFDRGDRGNETENKSGERESFDEVLKERQIKNAPITKNVKVIHSTARNEGIDVEVMEGGKFTGGEEHNEEQREDLATLEPIENMFFQSYAKKIDENNKRLHIVAIGAPGKQECYAKLRAGTDDGYDRLQIKDVHYVDSKDPCEFTGDMIRKIRLDKDGRAALEVEFDTREKYSLSAILYENK